MVPTDAPGEAQGESKPKFPDLEVGDLVGMAYGYRKLPQKGALVGVVNEKLPDDSGGPIYTILVLASVTDGAANLKDLMDACEGLDREAKNLALAVPTFNPQKGSLGPYDVETCVRSRGWLGRSPAAHDNGKTGSEDDGGSCPDWCREWT